MKKERNDCAAEQSEECVEDNDCDGDCVEDCPEECNIKNVKPCVKIEEECVSVVCEKFAFPQVDYPEDK